MSGRTLTFLDPVRARLRRGPAGLTLDLDGVLTVALVPRKAYPWSAPQAFVALVNAEEETVAMIEDVAQLEPASRQALDEELVERRFLPEIREVVTLKFQRNLYVWEVQTDRGRRTFRTSHGWGEEPVRRTDRGHVLITATDGVRYRLGDPSTMSLREQELLATIL